MVVGLCCQKSVVSAPCCLKMRRMMRKSMWIMGLLLLVRETSGFAGLQQSAATGPLQSSVRKETTALFQSDRSIPVHRSSTAITSSRREVLIEQTKTAASTTGAALRKSLEQSWYALPLFLCLVPLVAAAMGTTVATPDWWKLFDVSGIHQVASRETAVGLFLASNLSYLVAGGAIVHRYPGRPADSLWKIRPRRKTVLGLWVLGAGLMSTCFHAVQAAPDYGTAESLCYLDHGVALTTIAHFFRTCGPPRSQTLYMAGLAIATLVWPVSDCLVYTALHSSWHVLSGATAVLWAMQEPGSTTSCARMCSARRIRQTAAALVPVRLNRTSSR